MLSGVRISDLPPRDGDGAVHVFVEIPKGGHNKYEVDEELGVMRFDRALHSAVYYPAEYGFVPGTKSEDGERLDALVLMDEPTFPGCLVSTRLLGTLTIEGDGGGKEHKLLAVPLREPRFAEYEDISDLPEHVLREIENFFDTFKRLEGSSISSKGWAGAEEAARVLEAAVDGARGSR
jgi:inorganic pyrophosphatase